MPIPLGANRPWAWNFFQICIFLLTIGCAYQARRRVWLGLNEYRTPLLIWLGLIIITSFQMLALPASIVSVLSPNAYDIQSTLNASQYYLSLDPGQTEISFFKLLALFCLFFCVVSLVNSEFRIKALLSTMVACGTFQALYGAIEILFASKVSWVFALPVENVATGSFVYKNHFANFLMMCLAAGIGLMVTSLQKDSMRSPRDWMRSIASTLLSNKALIRISLAIMVIGLVMSRSRMGNAAFFIAMTLVGVLALLLIKNKSKGLSLLVVSMFIIDLFIVSAWFGLEQVQQRLAQTSLQQESRDEVVRDAVPMLFDYPLVGTGAGSFYSTFPAYKTNDVHMFYDHAHNDYLQMAIEYGLIGFTLMLAMGVYALYKSLRAMRTRRNSIFKGTGFACAMVVIGMGIHMTVDFPLQAFANACYFVTFIALATICNRLQLYRLKQAKHT